LHLIYLLLFRRKEKNARIHSAVNAQHHLQGSLRAITDTAAAIAAAAAVDDDQSHRRKTTTMTT